MFCSNCKVEYRSGIRECADCHVPLVEYLSEDSSSSATAASDEMRILWTGTDSEFAGFLAESLDRAELKHNDDSVELGFLRAFPRAVFKISVRTRDSEAAERILQDVINGNATDPPTMAGDLARDAATLNPYRGLNRRIWQPPDKHAAPFESVGLFGSESPSDPMPDDIVDDFDPDQASCEVWSGEDRQMAENCRMCLREVGIGSDLKQVNAQFTLRVEPSAEARAKEVIREIVEQTPPE